MEIPGFNIAAVERDTGLSKDVLRMWERRYGFPVPERDANGDRVYPADQVARLRLIKRLMDLGHRPGKLVGLAEEALVTLAPPRNAAKGDTPSPPNDDLEGLLGFIRLHDVRGYQQALQQCLARQGLQGFVEHTVAPLARHVGNAWEEGRIEVFEEHLFTELTKRLLRQAIAAVPATVQGPRVLLTTVPEEPHVLGLLMVEALLALEGATCIPLGTQVPLLEIARAAEAHRADIVGLSFSLAFPQRQIPGILEKLRGLLPAPCRLWVGGSGVRRTPAQSGVHVFHDLAEATAALVAWREQGGLQDPVQ